MWLICFGFQYSRKKSYLPLKMFRKIYDFRVSKSNPSSCFHTVIVCAFISFILIKSHKKCLVLNLMQLIKFCISYLINIFVMWKFCTVIYYRHYIIKELTLCLRDVSCKINWQHLKCGNLITWCQKIIKHIKSEHRVVECASQLNYQVSFTCTL